MVHNNMFVPELTNNALRSYARGSNVVFENNLVNVRTGCGIGGAIRLAARTSYTLLNALPVKHSELAMHNVPIKDNDEFSLSTIIRGCSICNCKRGALNFSDNKTADAVPPNLSPLLGQLVENCNFTDCGRNNFDPLNPLPTNLFNGFFRYLPLRHGRLRRRRQLLHKQLHLHARGDRRDVPAGR